MNKRIDINTDWLLRSEEIETTIDFAAYVSEKKEGWMECSVPCDVRMPLIEYGIIKDPVLSNYSFESKWIEEKSWWFKKTLDVASEELEGVDKVELVLESLDCYADIFLNGVRIGHHENTFYPFRCDVKKLIKPCGNELLIRITTGLENVSDNDIARIRNNISLEKNNRGDLRRVMLRKPQYSMGWDWNPRNTSCGIMKDCYLIIGKDVAISDFHCATESCDSSSAILSVKAMIENYAEIKTKEALLEASLCYDGEEVYTYSEELYLQSGINPVKFK